MCHGIPYRHLCKHRSVRWYNCPSGHFDPQTGISEPCDNRSFAATQESQARCVLSLCDYHNSTGEWICCKCGNFNQETGWCTGASPDPHYLQSLLTQEYYWIDTCDHGCCKACIKDPNAAQASNNSEGPQDPKTSKGKDSKSSKSSKGSKGRKKGMGSQTDSLAEDLETEQPESSQAAYENIVLDYSAKPASNKSKSKGELSKGKSKAEPSKNIRGRSAED